MQIIGIIATKDRPDSFLKAIESAVSQNRELDGIIVVSDSTDENYEHEKEICEKYNAVLIKDMYTHNYAGSLNTTIHKIIADRLYEKYDFQDIYVAFLDDDDCWHKDYIERCENSITNHEDFLICGINYCNEEKTEALSIPQKVEINDFLKGNPHIQGSNTFINLPVLLKAGMFDENMPSCTDRDLFVRVMLLNPSYVVVNEWLVDINADNNRRRITNDNEKKITGLQTFYHKYGGLMSKEIKDAFFERAEHLFKIKKTCIETMHNISFSRSNLSLFSEKYKWSLIIGFIVTEYDLGLRLLGQLVALQRKEMTILILINFTNPVTEYKDILEQSGYSYHLITFDEIRNDIKDNALIGLVTESQLGKIPILDIAVSRTLLQHYLYIHSREGDVIWVVDEDMELYDLRMGENGLVKRPVDIEGTIQKYHKDYDAVIGNYALDAPLPALSTIRTSLLDYAYNKINATNNNTFMRVNNDYYYDLTDENNLHLEMPLKLPNDISLDCIFSGKAVSRPLYIDSSEVKDVKSRGGNTFIFNRELLRIPNWSLQIGDKMGRRSDYFWVLLAKKRGYKLASIPFALLHNRNETSFNYKKEKNKFLLDLIGSSFVKAIEAVSIDAEWRVFFDAYKSAFMHRLTKFFTSYYRIIGLLQIIGDDNPYAKEFTPMRLNEFIKNTENYVRSESVINAFKILKRDLWLQKQILSYTETEEELKRMFNISTVKLLGFGSEGIVFADSQFVYKWFYQCPKNWCFLKKLSFVGCPEMYEIETIEKDDRFIIRYKYELKTDYNGGYSEQLADLIAFGKEKGFVFTNIKQRNFVVAGNQLKLIDYGHSIEPYSEESYIRSIKRCYEMLRFPFLSDSEFGNLIALHYGKEKAEAIDCGYENFKMLIDKRQKENIHDSVIHKLLCPVKNLKILDYGAGKCKIANALACDNRVVQKLQFRNNFRLKTAKYRALDRYFAGLVRELTEFLNKSNDVSVYDTDKETLYERAGTQINIVESIASLASDSFDVVLNNLVLCVTPNKINTDILADITRLLKPGGRAIISICDPFFDDIKSTELRTDGNWEDYHSSSIFDICYRYTNKTRHEYHRPMEYYENLLHRHGLEIRKRMECGGVDTKTILPTGEHIVFDCVLASKNTLLPDCSLMIKTNPMEHETIYASIKHITGQLEKGIRFYERIVVVDANEKEDRARCYTDDNLDILLSELNRAKTNGLIDRIINAAGSPEIVSEKYEKYFGLKAANPHAENGQGLYATLTGFDEVKTPIVFQTDSDILYKNNNPDVFVNALTKARKAVTVCLSIVHRESVPETYGQRTEVRSCFINLEYLYKLLPLPNSVQENTIQLPWHRALDNKITASSSSSIRLHSKELFFVHPQNIQKSVKNFVAYARQNIENGRLPEIQYDSVDMKGIPDVWLQKVDAEIILYIRGFNTSCSKIKRLFDSLKKQTYQDFFIVYLDDASKNGSADYAKFILEHDIALRDKHYTILNEVNSGSLQNLVTVMKNIVVNPEAVIINIDNDDCLVMDTAIERIVAEFNDGADISCGNCFRHDKPLKEYEIYSFDKVWERGGDNIWLHPKCFRRKLFDYIDIENDLKIDGQFVDVNADFAFLLPMIEHSRKSVFIKDILYYFEPSKDNQNSDGKYGKENKEKVREELLEKARRRYEKNNISDR